MRLPVLCRRTSEYDYEKRRQHKRERESRQLKVDIKNSYGILHHSGKTSDQEGGNTVM